MGLGRRLHELREEFLDLSRRPPGDNWASRTLDLALWRSTAYGLAGWSVLLGVLAARGDSDAALFVPHACFALIAMGLARLTSSRAPRILYFVLLDALFLFDLLSVDDPLASVAVSTSFFVAATAFLILSVRDAAATSVGPFALAVGLIVGGVADSPLMGAVLISTICYAACASILRSALVKFAADNDVELERASLLHQQYLSASAEARTSAEFARTLHDTVINTLSAIASGGSVLRDVELVRRRCIKDLERVNSMLSERAIDKASLRSLQAGTQLTIDWTGLPISDLGEIETRLAPETLAALLGSLRELLNNVEKHAGVDRVTIEVEPLEDVVVVTVVDRGRGFSSEQQLGTGLTQSVLDRAREASIVVEIRSSLGQGTRVRLVCPARHVTDGFSFDQDVDPEYAADRLRHAGTWGWCIAVCLNCSVVSLLSPGSLRSLVPVGLVTVLSSIAWLQCRGTRRLPCWAEVAVSLGVPASFALGAISATSGASPVFWHGIGVTPLLVILLNVGSARRSLWAAVLGLFATAGALAWMWRAESAFISGLILMNLAVQIAQLGVWLTFSQALEGLTTAASHARRRMLKNTADLAAMAAAGATQQRWLDARLDTSLEVLRDIASRRMSPLAKQIQLRSAHEEHFLRQLLKIQPELMHLGPWLTLILGKSRERQIYLTYRLGETDAPNAEVAAGTGRFLLRLLESAPTNTDIAITSVGKTSEWSVNVVVQAESRDQDFLIWSRSNTDQALTVRLETHSAQHLVTISAA